MEGAEAQASLLEPKVEEEVLVETIMIEDLLHAMKMKTKILEKQDHIEQCL